MVLFFLIFHAARSSSHRSVVIFQCSLPFAAAWAAGDASKAKHTNAVNLSEPSNGVLPYSTRVMSPTNRSIASLPISPTPEATPQLCRTKHGRALRRRDHARRRRIAGLAWSDREIARSCCVSAPLGEATGNHVRSALPRCRTTHSAPEQLSSVASDPSCDRCFVPPASSER